MVFEENKQFNIVSAKEKSIVYFLLNENEVVYVGQSKNGLVRPFSHNDKEYTDVAYIRCDIDMLDELETKYINKYSPIYNKKRGNSDYSLNRIKRYIRKNTNFTKITVNDIKKVINKIGIKTSTHGKITYISENDFKNVLNFLVQDKA